ncbi:hypothetical protein [Solibacillus sp. FSL K6-1523]|uniref:hypothetical protein n=1 Tax=Solibacillus sp. FSL K6-1523 TaxID=2921471 RepID=UPI0030F7EB39
MSFVSVVGMHNFISVVADKRATNSETGEIITENYSKIRVFNDSQFVSCTGKANAAEFVFKQCSDVGYLDLAKAAQELKELIQEAPEYKIDNLLGVIGGKNNKGELAFYTFTNNPDIKVEEYKPNGTNMSFTFLASGKVKENNLDLDFEFKKLYEEMKPRDIEEIINLQKNLNDKVADVDFTVNKTIDYIVLT